MNQHRAIDAPRPAPAEIAAEEVAFTVRDFLAMRDCGAFEAMRVELVGGRLLKMTPPHLAHGKMVARLMLRLGAALADPDLLSGEVAVRVDDLTLLGPDLAVLTGTAGNGGALEASDLLLAIEIADSSLVRDLGQKQRDYARAGVPHYWVVDVNSRTVHVFAAPGAEGYAEQAQLPFGAPLAIPGGGASITLD